MLEKLLEEIEKLKEAKALLDDVWGDHCNGQATFSGPIQSKLEEFYDFDQSE